MKSLAHTSCSWWHCECGAYLQNALHNEIRSLNKINMQYLQDAEQYIHIINKLKHWKLPCKTGIQRLKFILLTAFSAVHLCLYACICVCAYMSKKCDVSRKHPTNTYIRIIETHLEISKHPINKTLLLHIYLYKNKKATAKCPYFNGHRLRTWVLNLCKV
jgi:hypothetical protein